MTNQKKKYTIGVDIGGTKMSAVLYDGEKVLADYTLATPKDTQDHLLVMLQALIEPLEEKARDLKVKVGGLGLGVAGVIDYEEQKMLHSPNIPLIDGVKIIERLQEKIDLPMVMDNDANCFVRAEVLRGAGQKYNNVYGIIIGTGIGGGWWINNEAYKGAHGGAGEPGEMIIDFQERIGLEEAYKKLTQNNPASLAEEAYRGDVLAQKTFTEVGQFLGLAFANIVNLIDPEIIVIGGGVVESSDLFLSTIRKSMKEYIDSSESRKKVKVVKGKAGEFAGAIGAALLNIS
ncbi:ROK family protein [Patescibacteria group bacterium]